VQLSVYTHDVVACSLQDSTRQSQNSGNEQRIIQTTLYGNRNAKENRPKLVETQANTLCETSREV